MNKWTVKYLISRTKSSKPFHCTFPVLSAPMQIMIKPKHDHPMGEEERRPVGHGPPPGCSVQALVSTWLCPLSASQRADEWGSIETNSLCRTQLMGLPGLGRRGAAVGLWLLILPHKHDRNLPPGICPVTKTNRPLPSPPPFLYTHGYVPKYPLCHLPTQATVVHSLVAQNREEEMWCLVQKWTRGPGILLSAQSLGLVFNRSKSGFLIVIPEKASPASA